MLVQCWFGAWAGTINTFTRAAAASSHRRCDGVIVQLPPRPLEWVIAAILLGFASTLESSTTQFQPIGTTMEHNLIFLSSSYVGHLRLVQISHLWVLV